MQQPVAMLGIGVFMTLIALVCLTTVHIDLDEVPYRIDDKFVSICMDDQLLGDQPKWSTFNFSSPRIHTLLRGLSPAYLRFGGSPADYSVFTEESSAFIKSITGILQTLTKKDISSLVLLTHDTGLRLLFEFNLQLRQGTLWNPTNAISMIEYLRQQGLARYVDFELGNEPDYYGSSTRHFTHLTADQISHAYKTLRTILKHYPETFSAKLVGPDIVGNNNVALNMFSSFLNSSGDYIDAATFHHYYFHGPDAKVGNYIDVKYFNELERYINLYSPLVRPKGLPMWIGETSDSWGSGTPNVSDRYASGFLWLDKLGLSASMGVEVVMRQTFYGYDYSLINKDLQPNPDYWLSWVHKQLVGNNVLKAYVKSDTFGWQSNHSNTDDTGLIRIYAHCTKLSKRYGPGSITLLAININTNSTANLQFTPELTLDDKVDRYILTPGDSDGLLSRYVNLNGARLSLVSDSELPDLIPDSSNSTTVELPPLTFGFFVFPTAYLPACM